MKAQNFLLAVSLVFSASLSVGSYAQTAQLPNQLPGMTDPSVAAPVATPLPDASAPAGVPGVAGPLSDTTPNAAKSMVGVAIPAPPPPAGLVSDPAQLKAQADLQAEAQADADKQKRDVERNKKAYERAAGGMMPLSTEQIRDFMRRMEDTDDASRPRSYGNPKAEMRMATLALDPGAALPEVHLQTGYVTTINVMDITGQPWPILDVGVGGNFEVSPTHSGSQVVRIMPLAANADGNLSVLLKDLPTPIIFRLSTDSHQVDMRFDARIPKMGPNAKVPLISRPRLEAGNETLISLLQNNPPADAQRLKISGLDARTMAWSFSGHTYVRTPLQLLSPAWNASVSSDDGMTVYEVGDAPILLMSDNGALIRAKLLRDN